jgi:predicted NodU family carbamoyl transferase
VKSLLLTLGHNSSAVLMDDNRVAWGYETERISGAKSDSNFPARVLERRLWSSVDMVYVTHWAPTGQLIDMSHKHWRPEFFDGIPVRSLSPSCSHHDTHIAGAMCYAGPRFPYGRKTIGVVVDGFGILGEHFSVYQLEAHQKPRLLRRVHGYGTSLGLWYQYATAFMGMKMHEDEYKLLGYEAHIREEDAEDLDRLSKSASEKWLEWMGQSVYGSEFDPVYNLAALEEVKKKVFGQLLAVCKYFGLADPSADLSRRILSYYVQRVLERVVVGLIDLSAGDYTNMICSGGVFYNVKLNKILLDQVAERGGQMCVYPLAGDQGCALGLYAIDHPALEFPKDLNWGVRELYDVGEVKGLIVFENELEAVDYSIHRLRTKGVVNLVRGAMEFGPRAMCNTSTIALPNRKVVRKINTANERNTVMPMAPVMSETQYTSLLEKTPHVWRSHRHMIMAMEMKEHPLDNMLGCTHEYHRPTKHHTCRPQVVGPSDGVMTKMLSAFGHPLINTSFNYHGMPIAFDMPSIIQNHNMQHQRDNDFHTVVIQNV